MQVFRVILSDGALEDVERERVYYDGQAPGLGDRFADDFWNAFDAVERNPFVAAIRYDDVRCFAFEKFPFALHYTVNADVGIVTIAAVFNTHRKPRWERRNT